jgi:hypothetical protein
MICLMRLFLAPGGDLVSAHRAQLTLENNNNVKHPLSIFRIGNHMPVLEPLLLLPSKTTSAHRITTSTPGHIVFSLALHTHCVGTLNVKII